MDGGNETPLDPELVVENLGDRGEAVGGAGSVGDDVLAGVCGVVHTIDEHRSGIFGRSGHDDLLGSGLDVFPGGLVGEEETGGLDHDLGADLIPLKVGGIHLGGDTDALSVDDEIAVLDLDVALELAMDRIILEHVSEILGIEKVIDTDDLDVASEILDSSAENHAADAAESVNT